MGDLDWLNNLRAPDHVYDNRSTTGLDTGFIYYWGEPNNHQDSMARVAISTKASGAPHVMQVEHDLYVKDADEILRHLQDADFRKEHGLEP